MPTIPEQFQSVIGTISSYLSKFVVAVIIILIGFIIGRILGRLIQKLLHEIELNKIVRKATGIRLSLEEIIGNFFAYFIYFIAIVMALTQIGLTTIVLHMISAAVIVLILLSIFLGVKDFIPNVLAGIFIYKNKLVEENDNIRVKETEGRVVSISLVETKIKTKKGDIIFIPNSILTNNEVTKLKKA